MTQKHTESQARPNKSPFRAVVAYEDRNAAARAMGIFASLARHFGDEFDAHCEVWRLDVLGLPQAQEAAARACAAADLVIVSARCGTDLEALCDLLGKSLAGDRRGATALVAVLESNHSSEDTQCQTRHLLQSIAARHLMDFFLHEVPGAGTPPELTVDAIQRRANTVSSVMEGILLRPEAVRPADQP